MSAKMNLPVALPLLGEEECEGACAALRSGWVTQGPRVKAFEERFCAATGAPYACAVSNCTAALHVALLGAGVRPGDVVITVSHTFIATANAVRACGAEPVFVDIDLDTLNMSPLALRQCLENDFEQRDGAWWYAGTARFDGGESLLGLLKPPVGRLAAVLVVHQLGMPADMDAILPLAARYGVPVVEDAACALGSGISLQGGPLRPIGSPIGQSSCFSFHPRKVLTTGDGGMIATGDAALDAKFRLQRQHGMSVPDAQRHKSSSVVFESYLVTGHNFRLTDIQAAVGLAQLDRLDSMVAHRRRLAQAYAEALAEIPGVAPQREGQAMRSNWQSYAVLMPEGAPQREVMQRLLDEGISTRRGVMCCHLEPPYQQSWPQGCLPASEAARDRGIILPLHHKMTPEDCAVVAQELGRAIKEARA